ncbi:hypothetical protein Trydic_g35 [Trypoxylus dichotomus]
MQFTYLGVKITRSKSVQQEVRAQMNKASRISGYLRHLIWRNKYMSAESKLRKYKTAVRLVLTYAVEARADTTKAKNMVRAAEMKTLRAIKGMSLKDQMRNKVIREVCENQNIVLFMRIRRRFWRDHVHRMTEGQCTKRAKDEKPNSKKGRRNKTKS